MNSWCMLALRPLTCRLGRWVKDIDEISGSRLRFPIIGDKERKVAYAYDMLDHQDITNVDQKGIAFTIRSVFIIDPKKTIRLIMSYPASTGNAHFGIGRE